MLRSRRGVAALEFALVGGLFFIAVLAGVDMGRYYMFMHALRHTVAEAGRAAMVERTCSSNSTVGDPALASARSGFLGTSLTLNVSCTQPDPTNNPALVQYTITANRPFTWVIPVFGVANTPLRETAVFTFRRV